jgi:hypothetical protein
MPKRKHHPAAVDAYLAGPRDGVAGEVGLLDALQ